MRTAGGLDSRLLVVVAITTLGGCAKGVEADGLTFGPAPATDTGPNPSTATDPIDPTGVDSFTTTGMATDDADGTATDPTDPTDSTDSTDPTGPATTTGSSSTGPAGPVCGDDLIEGDEECDGLELGEMTCPDVDPMFTGGTLGCDASCAFDTAMCSTAENPIVMCQVVNAAIPDNSAVGVSDTITLPAGSIGGTITDVDVEVQLTHTYIGDLEIDVTANGTSVVLFNSCGTEENLHYTFDDSGGVLSCATSNVNNVVQPASPLSGLNGGLVPAGWTLFVEDQAGLDTGTLTQWCVTVSWM